MCWNFSFIKLTIVPGYVKLTFPTSLWLFFLRGFFFFLGKVFFLFSFVVYLRNATKKLVKNLIRPSHATAICSLENSANFFVTWFKYTDVGLRTIRVIIYFWLQHRLGIAIIIIAIITVVIIKLFFLFISKNFQIWVKNEVNIYWKLLLASGRLFLKPVRLM